jgi:AcrR family transcriptional regulator
MTPTAVTRDATSLEDRLVDAMLECIGRWGLAKTTADDVARTAGVSRATLYRAFPGGKDVALEALVRREVARFFDRVTPKLDAATTAEDLLVVGAVEAAEFLRSHAALGYVLDNEPERVLPGFAAGRLDPGLAVATAFVAGQLDRFVPDATHAAETAELVVRLLLSYAIDPSPMVDLTDARSVRRFVRTFVLPILIPKEP